MASGPCGELSSCDSTTALAKSGRGRSRKKKWYYLFGNSIPTGGPPASALPTFTLCMFIMLPQSSMYCFKSLSCRKDWHHQSPTASSCVSHHSGPTRYSKTSMRLLSVWTMSCSVTMLACLRSFSSDTRDNTTTPLFIKLLTTWII